MTDTAETKEYTLEKDCELRFEIESKTQITVEVSFYWYLHDLVTFIYLNRQIYCSPSLA